MSLKKKKTVLTQRYPDISALSETLRRMILSVPDSAELCVITFSWLHTFLTLTSNLEILVGIGRDESVNADTAIVAQPSSSKTSQLKMLDK